MAGVPALDTQCPDLLRRVFSDCSVESFAVREVTSIVRSAIVLVKSTTNFLSVCVAVARFANAIVWSCCITVNNAVLACADCTLAAYTLVFEVLEDLRVSLKDIAK